jgi:hypothetical protein
LTTKDCGKFLDWLSVTKASSEGVCFIEPLTTTTFNFTAIFKIAEVGTDFKNIHREQLTITIAIV